MPICWVLKWRITLRRPSPLTFSKADWAGAASVPVAPKQTVVGLTVVAQRWPSSEWLLELSLVSGVDCIGEEARLNINGDLKHDLLQHGVDELGLLLQ